MPVPAVVLSADCYDRRFVIQVTMNGTFYLVETNLHRIAEEPEPPQFRLTNQLDEATEYGEWVDDLTIAERYIYSPLFPDEVSDIRVVRTK